MTALIYMRLIYETALVHTDLLKLFISVRASISTCSVCHLICVPLPCPKCTLLYLVHQCFYPFLWISTLNKSTQLSLKESTAALTHYESFGTRNFRKKWEERKRKALHFGSSVHICQRTLGSVDLSAQFDLDICSTASCTGKNAFWNQRQWHSRDWMGEDKTKQK